MQYSTAYVQKLTWRNKQTKIAIKNSMFIIKQKVSR